MLAAEARAVDASARAPVDAWLFLPDIDGQP